MTLVAVLFDMRDTKGIRKHITREGIWDRRKVWTSIETDCHKHVKNNNKFLPALKIPILFIPQKIQNPKI